MLTGDLLQSVCPSAHSAGLVVLRRVAPQLIQAGPCSTPCPPGAGSTAVCCPGLPATRSTHPPATRSGARGRCPETELLNHGLGACVDQPTKFASLDQLGTKPHFTDRGCRSSTGSGSLLSTCSSTTRTSWVGTKFYDGRDSSPTTNAPVQLRRLLIGCLDHTPPTRVTDVVDNPAVPSSRQSIGVSWHRQCPSSTSIKYSSAIPHLLTWGHGVPE